MTLVETMNDPTNLPEWEPCDEDDLPVSFRDPAIDDFRIVCSNGFIGDLSIGSAFSHSPRRWPQCFPNGADSYSTCKSSYQRRKQASV